MKGVQAVGRRESAGEIIGNGLDRGLEGGMGLGIFEQNSSIRAKTE